MFTVLRSKVRPALWIAAPSILSSLFLQSFAVCIDPFVLPAIERRLPSKLAFAVRWLWIVLFIISMLYAWNIIPGSYVFYIREALPFTPKPILAGLLLALAILVWVGIERKPVEHAGYSSHKSPVFLIGLALLLTKILLTVGTLDIPSLRQQLRSPGLSNFHMLFAGKKGQKRKIVEETPQLTFNALVKSEKFLPTQVIMMLVESWGETPDGLVSVVENIKAQDYHVIESGFTAYRGSTLSGEFRELCSKYVQPSDGLTDKAARLDCAPRFFANRGYNVIGLHGYKNSFYARRTFWERFGIKTRLFDEQLGDLPHCEGAFSGVCDENLIRYGISSIDKSEAPTFLYMLTLSSHEPVNIASLGPPGKYFASLKTVHPTQVVTRRAISELLDRLKDRSHRSCTLVYIAGDHQPPSASAKGGIFKRGEVPYVAFTDHCSASQDRQLAVR